MQNDQDEHISIDFDWFASRPHWFPWQELGLDRPKYGPAHSYACTILAPLSKLEHERRFLVQRPSLRELARFVGCHDPEDKARWPALASKIYESFRDRDNNGNPRHPPTGSVEYQVIRFLTGIGGFRSWAERRLTLLWQAGRLSAPEGALERRRKQVFGGHDW